MSGLQDRYLQLYYFTSRWQFAPVFSHPPQALLEKENQTIERCKSVVNYWSAHTHKYISGWTLFISDYFCVCVFEWECVCLCLSNSGSHAVVRRHHHAACCCPFSGLVPMIITTQVAAHQSSQHQHHVRLLQTRCLQHPTGTTSPPPCSGEGSFHSCVVIFCYAACIVPFFSLHML